MQTNKLISMHDSTEEKYYVEILPLGHFQYNTQTGFTGQASSVKLYGKRQSHTGSKDSTAATTALTTQTNRDHQHQTKETSNHTTKVTTKKSPAINWLWLIPVAAFLFLLLRNRLFN